MPPRELGARYVPRRAVTLGLHEEAQEVYGNRCPCCDRVMVKHRPNKTRWKVPSDHPTVAHDVATGHGGNPAVWVYTCAACNRAQGTLTFEQWGRNLAYFKDERAERVRRLAKMINDWRAEHEVPAMVASKKRRPTPWHSAAE